VANDNGKPNVDTLVNITHFQPLGNVRKYYEKETHIPSKVTACIMVQLLEALKYPHGLGRLKRTTSHRIDDFETSAIQGELLIMAASSPPEL